VDKWNHGDVARELRHAVAEHFLIGEHTSAKGRCRSTCLLRLILMLDGGSMDGPGCGEVTHGRSVKHPGRSRTRNG